MKYLEDEKELAKEDHLILTNKRLISEKHGSFSEFPLSKLDSIEFQRKFHWKVAVVGLGFLIFSFWFMGLAGNSSIIPFFYLISFILVIIGIIPRKMVIFRSISLSIKANKRNLDDFIQKVRKETY